jgi:outer membrane lipoprotein SlyB
MRALLALLALLGLAGCETQSQNQYSYAEVGQTQSVSFGTVVSSRPVGIIGKNTGGGALVGAAAGGGAMSYVGNGPGQPWAIAAGALVGAAVGAIAEQKMSDKKGIEYTVTLEDGLTVTNVQELKEGERVLQPGERVMLQNTGQFQRVIPADNLPTSIPRPKGIKVTDD